MKRLPALLLSVFLLAGTAAQAGPVFLTGHDPDFHAQTETGARNLWQAALGFVTGDTWNLNDGNKFLWVESNIAVPSGHRRGKNALTVTESLSEGVHFDHVDASGLASVDFSNYTAIAIASSFGGLLTRAELEGLISRKADIATFINGGGGLFAGSECYPCGQNLLAPTGPHTGNPDLFGYLPIDVTATFNQPPYFMTAWGTSTFGLTDSDVNSASHNAFATTGGLNVVDTDINGTAMTLAGVVTVNDGGFSTVPEPATLGMLLAGIVAVGARRSVHRKP